MSRNSPKQLKTRRVRGLVVALLVALLLGAPPAGAKKGGDAWLTVPVSTVRNSRGIVFIALYDRAHWLEPGRYLAARKVKARPGVVFTRFRNLPRGNYAVAVWHDENSNNRVDTDSMGLPKEGYGFSRVTPRKKPKFKDVAVRAAPLGYAPIQLRY